MKKCFLIISLFFIHIYICVAQTQSNGSTNKIEDIKVAYMTKELSLTPEESQKFWPIYNNYFSEIKQAKIASPNDEVAFEEKVVEIRKKYKANFKAVLNSDDRVNKVFVSEKNLRDMLKKELQDRQRRRRFPGPRLQQQNPIPNKTRKVN